MNPCMKPLYHVLVKAFILLTVPCMRTGSHNNWPLTFLWHFPQNKLNRSLSCLCTESADCHLLLTSAGTRRLLPRCWLKERHQASVYPFMLGTYFLTVSSLSLSHTPSSLWIYRKTSNKHSTATPSCYCRSMKGGTHVTHSCSHIHCTFQRLQESQLWTRPHSRLFRSFHYIHVKLTSC